MVELIVLSTAANTGSSAMLAEEYILIVPFAYHLQSGLNAILLGNIKMINGDL
ncbi:MAG: hypothetical protein ABUT20_17655 [Bacteroidota bacterium]